MTSRKLQSIAIYVAIGIAILLAGAMGDAISAGLIPGFQDGQTFASVRGRVADLISLLVTAGGLWIAANRPRFGSEKLAAEVKQLQADGYSRSDMAVVPAEDAELLRTEATRLRRIKPLRDLAQADEALERQRG